MNTTNKTTKRTVGFTLVEILVVLVIATVVLSIAIPRIRAVNDERNTREAARVVGSAFSNASQRAKIDGVAGVRITRNANFVQSGLQFAASEVSLLRVVPNYTGDAAGAMIDNERPLDAMGEPEPDNEISIPLPFEQDALGIVRAGDLISFGNSSTKYRILSVDPGTNEEGMPAAGQMQLVLDLAGYLPPPTHDSTFSISRRPRVLRSSKTELPNNYIIDLRFSGFDVVDAATSQLTPVFEPILPGPITLTNPAGLPVTLPNPVTNNFDIDFIFDEEGSVDRIAYVDTVTNPTNEQTVATRIPLGPLHFFITESPDSVELTEPIATQDDTSLWVSISSLSGSTNIGYNNSATSVGQTYQSMTALYDGSAANRATFNTIISESRDNTLSSSANQ